MTPLFKLSVEDLEDDVNAYPFYYLEFMNRLSFNCTEEELQAKLATIDSNSIDYIHKTQLNKKLLGYIQFK